MTHGRAGTRRPFTILDGMVFVAATGLALTIERSYFRSFRQFPGYMMASFYRTTEAFYGATSCFVVCWMLTVLCLRLRRPRPGRRRLLREPGFAACVAAAAAIGLGTVRAGVDLLFDPGRARPSYGIHSWIYLTAGIGPAVIGAWFFLILGHRWRAEPSWHDRLGRLLGCYWVGVQLFWWLPLKLLMSLVPAT